MKIRISWLNCPEMQYVNTARAIVVPFQRLLYLLLIALSVELTCGRSVSADEQPATRPVPTRAVLTGPEFEIYQSDGSGSVGRFVRMSLEITQGRRLSPGMRLDFRSLPFQPRTSSPVRIVRLWTDEVIPAAWNVQRRRSKSGSLVSASLYGDAILPPLTGMDSAVASISQPAGCMDICPADPELRPAGTWQIVDVGAVPELDSLDEPIRAAWQRKRLEVQGVEEGLTIISGSWPMPGGEQSQPRNRDEILSTGGTLRFFFLDGRGHERILKLSGWNRQRLLLLPDGRQQSATVRSSNMLVQLRLGMGLTVSCDGIVVARSSSSPGQLIAIEAEGPFLPADFQPGTSGRFLTLREPLVRSVDGTIVDGDSSNRPLHQAAWRTMDDDRVILNSGDELYGFVDEAAEAVGVRRSLDEAVRRRIDRAKVRAVCFARPERVRASSVHGLFSQVDLVPDASSSLSRMEEPFWIRTAIDSTDAVGLRTRHPLLGTVIIRWSMIRRIRALFQGSYTLIDPGPRHLGNGFRESFSRVEPDGTELSLDFELEKLQPKESVFLSCDVAGLIPSGPGTLQVTPFLDEVRAGFLTTQVFLNGERVGTLNELISVRSPASAPERVRFQLPARLLKAGGNTIRLQQTSAKDDADSFDDCEIRALAIEVERPDL